MGRGAVGIVLASALSLFCSGIANADRVVDDYTGFTSPSGNIYCYIDPSSARCDIRERDWSPPPRPADCPSFTGYGQGIIVTPGRPATIVCAGDTTYNENGALAYGDSISAGVLRCTSTQSGMSCRDTQSGNGFTIARQGYQLF